MQTRTNRLSRLIFTTLGMLALSLSSPGYLVQASASSRAAGPQTTFVVNSTADLTDADQGDGICAAANGSCTLRAAVMQANFLPDANIITIPPGVYTLTRSGDEDAAVLGDLDIIYDLTIQGAGSANTIIDGNGAVTNDRVFQILSSATNTSLSGLTIRNGKRSDVFGDGGGLAWDGGGTITSQLLLSDVIVDSNSAYGGGGLSLNYGAGGSVELDNVVIRSNKAVSAGAGMAVGFRGGLTAFTMKGGKVYNNTGTNQGGGIELGGTQDGTSTESIQNVEIYGNKSNFGAGIDNEGGVQPYKMDVLDSYLHNNQATFYGGAIYNFAVITVTRSTLDANSAGTDGGGLFNQSNISASQEKAAFIQSTISGNSAQYGGGIYSNSTSPTGVLTTLTNTTLSGNTATRDGGGLYAYNGEAAFYSATIAANKVLIPTGDPYAGEGAGLYVLNPVLVTLQNTLIADNAHRYGVNGPVADDCYGQVTSLGNNLIQTLLNCLIGSADGSPPNIYGIDPRLGSLANNGGPTLTQLPSQLSPVIDAGQLPACTGPDGSPLANDQRLFPRILGAHCDIGAVERGPMVYLPLIKK